MIGKVLQGRYQIVQSLGAGVFGQTYVALDIYFPEKPRYVVKQLKTNHSYTSSSYYDYLRLRLLTETETLIHLGSHDQIPQLITCFEENQQFYLVQEYIPGQELSAELPICQDWSNRWRETDVIQFLADVLGIIEFVHAQGFIHCDIKPENLIRRAYDGKLVLIDFGSIQPIDSQVNTESSVAQIPVTSLGYIPPEQFIGQAKPNSDIYALGMIAIQALTGLTPLQLKVDPTSNEIKWRSEYTPVNDYLAAVLSQMIRYNHQERFQTATEVLQIIRQTNWSDYTGKNNINLPEIYLRENGDEEKKSYPLLAGLKFGLAINSLLIGIGVYSLLNTSLGHSEAEILCKAIEEYKIGDLQKAIALAKSIPDYSNVYPEAQATLKKWQSNLKSPTEKTENTSLVAESSENKPVDKSGWTNIIGKVSSTFHEVYSQPKIPKQVKQPATEQISSDVKAYTLLTKAYTKAANRDFSAALAYLGQIPPESYLGGIVRQKLIEYSQKQQIRSVYFLRIANNRASIGDFHSAIDFLQKIPPNTTVYPQAQIKLNEYTQKLNSRYNKQKSDKVMSFNPENYLSEINI